MMELEKTLLSGVYILKPKVFEDHRGYFFESYNKNTLLKLGIDCNFVQDNQSHSTYGVLRGLHYQKGEHAQAKLVRVLHGEILDVAVDLRPNSDTYLQHVAVRLSSENKLQLFIPRGFAHGFVVLSQTADVLYKCDNYYHPESEDGLMYDDSKIDINWILKDSELIINPKDTKYKYM